VTITSEDREGTRTFAELFDAICTNVASAIHGKDDVIRLTVTCLVARGHLLLEDVPGVGKTSLAKALARSVDARFGRVQFTPDLLPSDVVGTSVWNQGDGSFEFRPGPVFTQLLLGDEINRASPKTQSALLEAMAEEQVTVDGATYPLHRPFMVIATQNPLEHHGTFPLPESQLDRFLMKLSLGYPGRAAEMSLLREEDHDQQLSQLRPIASAADVNALARAAQRVHVAEALAAYLIDLAERSRSSSLLSLGISPRASLGLLRAARVWAAASGRNYVSPDDIKDLAVPVLAHRVVVGSDGRLGGTAPDEAITELLRTTPVPS
jgi:MoxR-like ATPase